MFKTYDIPSKKILDLYRIPNPKYYQLKKLKKNTYGTPEYLSLVTKGFVPPGVAYWSFKEGEKINIISGEHKGDIKYPKSIISLRDYQKTPVEELAKIRIGLFVAPTGSGKLVCSAEIIRRVGLKSLVLCHSVDMVKQFQQEFEKFLGEPVGVYYGKEKKLKNITITTYDSAISKKEYFEDFGFGVLVVDEADLFITPKRLFFLNSFKSARKYGFTATPRVPLFDDLIGNNITLLERLWGKFIRVETSLQTDVLKKIVFRQYGESQYVDEKGKIIYPHEWHKFRKAVDEDIQRKKDQCSWILEKSSKEDYSIVLLDRVYDIEFYCEVLKKLTDIPVYELHGELNKKIREENIQSFKDGGGILVANIKIAGRGFSIPSANKAFIACPVSGESVIRQAVGRILRWQPEKESILYDWIDYELRHQLKKRMGVYREFYKDVKYFKDS